MKRVYIYKFAGILGCLLLAITSCNLDIVPENSLVEKNAFDTEKELNGTTALMHFSLNLVAGHNPVHMQIGLKADEVDNANELRLGNPMLIVNEEQSWKDLYDVIYAANMLKENYKQANMSEERNNFHLGQANFCAGLAYFLLAQRYGDCIITKGAKNIQDYATSPAIDVVNTAIELAQEAYQQLPVKEQLKDLNGNALTHKQWASKGTATALLAQLYAWKGSLINLYEIAGNATEAYQKSVAYASELIENKVGDYSLVESPEKLCELFSNPALSNPEVIFSIAFDEHRSVTTVSPNEVATMFLSFPVNNQALLGDLTASTNARLYTSTIQEMYPDSNDLRRNAFFFHLNEPHEVDGQDYALTYKFRECIYEKDEYAPSGSSFRSLKADYIVWRLADLILLRAECLAKLGQSEKAIADLNLIRQRAGTALYPSEYDKNDLSLAIFKEREREFIAENDARYYDIIRNNYIRQELKGNFETLTTQEIKDGALYLPISSSAYLDKYGNRTNRKLRQNKYWSLYIK